MIVPPLDVPVRSRRARDFALIVGVALGRLALSGVAWRFGFRAVSDDDFARVTIAQRFAAEPHLDPTGTSWLPFPFWVLGGAMRVVGSSLDAARGVSMVCAALATAWLAFVALRAGLSRGRVLAASLFVSAMPWGMQLTLATVPEAPAAALAAAAAISLVSASPRLRMAGAVSLLASVLSRYDAWPLALAFAALTARDAVRARGRDRAWLAAAAVVALAGPVAWSFWEWAKFGDPLRYFGLVKSYRRALGQGPSLRDRLLGYPRGFFEELREVLILAVVALLAPLAAWLSFLARGARGARGARPLPAPRPDLAWGRPLALAALQVLLLIAGDVRDGAPTHHPERALLGPATVLVYASFDVLGALFVRAARRRRALVAFTAIVAMALWVGQQLNHTVRFYADAPRAREIAAGRALRANAAAGERVLLDTRDLSGGVRDYGYFATMAAFGHPLAVEVDRDQDPRKPARASSFEEPEQLRRRANEARARWLVAWGERHRAAALAAGATLVTEETRGAEAVRWALLRWP